MKTSETLVGRDVYARHTGKDGGHYVACHRVWDADRSFAARTAEAVKAGGKSRCDQITEEQYLKEKAR